MTGDDLRLRPEGAVPEGSGLLLLVDGHAYAYRAFHAIRHLKSPAGFPTNAIYGFIKMLENLEIRLKPTHEAVIWDGGLDEKRVSLLPGYKAQRPPMPEALAAQLDAIGDYLEAAGAASLCKDGVEADDWIATAACRAAKQGFRVVIASSDKDFMQLVSDQIGLVNPGDKSGAIWGREQVRARAGVEPGQIIDWLALVGDSVDNIPGVPGVGIKTAAGLLNRFGTVDQLLERLDEIESERIRQALHVSIETLRRNQKMIRLRADMPVECDILQWRRRAVDRVKLLALCRQWGFRSMTRDLEAGMVAEQKGLW
jgi:DNA polymerase I